MPDSLRILYVGSLFEGSTCRARMISLKESGHEVTDINTTPECVRVRQKRLTHRLMFRLVGPLDLANANRAVIRQLKAERYDVIWLDKPTVIRLSTLKAVERLCSDCLIVGYSPDDMIHNRNNHSRRFLRLLPMYDIMFTTNPHNVLEFRQLGCPRTEYVFKGFDPHTHRPIKVDAMRRRELGGQVGFIGSYERERTTSLLRLADNGIDVRIWGGGWHRCPQRHDKLLIEGQSVWAHKYAEAISSFDINLCFLRRANRDVQNSRGIEIPACGGFMIAERNEDFVGLFEEGKEAEFFSSDDELIDKVRFYLKSSDLRKRIAAAGYERCIKSGYSNHERFRSMLQMLPTLREKQNRELHVACRKQHDSKLEPI